jgi:RNA polymerase sigma factor (TIGR02999 family)
MTDSPLTDAEVTQLLEAQRHGDAAAADRLFGLVHGILHEIAARQLHGERPDHTLQPTILLHDAWLRLTANRSTPWNDRAHFFALATRAMRRLLVDHARARAAGKRRGDLAVDLDDNMTPQAGVDPIDLIALDTALDELAAVDDRARRVVELRFFGALEWPEIADVLGTSERTVRRDWRFARLWLRRRMDLSESVDDPTGQDRAP